MNELKFKTINIIDKLDFNLADMINTKEIKQEIINFVDKKNLGDIYNIDDILNNKVLIEYINNVIDDINHNINDVNISINLNDKQIRTLVLRAVKKISSDIYDTKYSSNNQYYTENNVNIDYELFYQLERDVDNIIYNHYRTDSSDYNKIISDLEAYTVFDLSKFIFNNESNNIYYVDNMEYHKGWDKDYKNEIFEYKESYVFPCGHYNKVIDDKIDSRKQSYNNHDCLICKLITKRSKAKTVSSQDIVVDLFKLGITNKSTSSGNYYSSGNYIFHYNTTEAIRLNDGTLIGNSQCWSAGFAVCSYRGDMYLPISTLRGVFGNDTLNMKILNKDKDGNTLLFINNRYILYGRDNQDSSEFLAECPKEVKTVKEALNSLNPLIEHDKSDYIRQGDLFFLKTDYNFSNFEKQHYIELDKALSYEDERNLGGFLKSAIDKIYPKLLNYSKYEKHYDSEKQEYIDGEIYTSSLGSLDYIKRIYYDIRNNLELSSFDKGQFISGSCLDPIVKLNKEDNIKLVSVYQQIIKDTFDKIKAPKELVRCKIFDTNHEAQFKYVDENKDTYVKGYIYHTNGSHHKYHLDQWCKVYRNLAKQTWQVTRRGGNYGGD